MFCTLRRSKNTMESYASELTTPPFAKPKSKFNAACANCRKSKLKCSGEPQGCQRCLTKNLQCNYLSFREGVSHNKSHTGPSETFPTEGNAVVETESEVQTHDSEVVSLSFDTLGCVDGFPIFGLSAAMPSRGDLDADLSSGISPCFDFEQQPALEPRTQTTDLDLNHLVNYHTQTPMEVSTIAEHVCLCFTRAVRIHEALEVDLLWINKKRCRDALDMLQHQKRNLVNSKILFECQHCEIQSPYVMLLLSILSKTSSALEFVFRDSRLGHTDCMFEVQQGENDHHTSCHHKSTFAMRQLDEEDERLVLKSLFKSRVAMLKALMTRLESMVRDQDWPAHKIKVGDLKDKVKDMEQF
ncbi:hypothetical protein BO94DRAFT_622010 [Aspergillus sclerotioniger CBS 115572]|uniref:Zn(2)-C6 fungal-type domain-containing protein n=1 Tax=Aspergillus sclerotioniger CBS 115572 TaxID=1450535 RepID=A0A317X9Q8_9EURO|nr:hypothetical protein BO94DRAFT_622010 [Aspergillus sclerotioniger CBS 115572]PWY93638.1 hypothetical protein BO94DRAFT_622010 [Aspergillus sclerotioniger CBS 115572]